MDWYAHAEDGRALRDLRHEIRDYLDRHSDLDSDVEGAELIAAELIQNAAGHTAGPLWVSLTWPGRHPVLRVTDLGPAFDMHTDLPEDPLAAGGGRGLFIVSHLAVELTAASRLAGGAVVTAALPVTRPASPSFEPRRASVTALPDLAEAASAGGFNRESFLRALVVQLAQTIELLEGPTVAEAAITQVGTDVGGQMEAEYRLAKDLVGSLTPEQIGECYVRLKHAIDGRFQVIEANAERIVLVNDRCPFAEVVQRAPALCRMTSSVFGGIAARNNPAGAQVVLEERIALGDAQCRVVVRLDAAADDTPQWAHRYPTPTDLPATPGAPR